MAHYFWRIVADSKRPAALSNAMEEAFGNRPKVDDLRVELWYGPVDFRDTHKDESDLEDRLVPLADFDADIQAELYDEEQSLDNPWRIYKVDPDSRELYTHFDADEAEGDEGEEGEEEED
jgi:hypothetical protein